MGKKIKVGTALHFIGFSNKCALVHYATHYEKKSIHTYTHRVAQVLPVHLQSYLRATQSVDTSIQPAFT